MSRRRRRGGGGGHGEGGDERWLLTYADMITLLLALFILLYAMSTIDVVRFEALSNSLSQQFQGQVFNSDRAITGQASEVLQPSATSQQQRSAPAELQRDASTRTAKTISRERAQLSQIVKGTRLKGNVQVATIERGIVVRLEGDAFFRSGSAEMNPAMESDMRRVAAALRQNRRQLSVEGHTDGQPISTAQYPSNWELSGARALTIMKFLLGEGIPSSRVRYVGYADTKPLVKPETPGLGVPKNRRVEIVVMAPGADKLSDDPASTDQPGSVNAPSRGGRGGATGPLSSGDLSGPIFDLTMN